MHPNFVVVQDVSFG